MAVNGSASKDDVAEAEIPEDDELDEVDRRPPHREISARKATSRRIPILLIGGALVAAIAVVAVLLSSTSSKKKSPPPFMTFVDRQAGFSLSYPSSWSVSRANDANVPLLLNIGASGLDTLLVRVFPLQITVNTANEADIKAVTDAVISGTKVNVLHQEPISVNGLPGYYYFYTLPADPATKTVVVHSHFFVFPPHQMVSLTFQTLEQDFSGLAHSFDQVMLSFRTAS
jgi:hypothetical protein